MFSLFPKNTLEIGAHTVRPRGRSLIGVVGVKCSGTVTKNAKLTRGKMDTKTNAKCSKNKKGRVLPISSDRGITKKPLYFILKIIFLFSSRVFKILISIILEK